MKFPTVILLLLISISCLSQTEWNPYIGLRVSTNADGYYVGASPQAGVNFQFKKELALSGYLHYFSRHIENTYADGTWDGGIYHSAIFALLLERNFYRMKNKGVILGGGLAIQYTSEDYRSSWYDYHLDRTIVVAAARIGYTFPICERSIVVEINAVGPHVSKTHTDPSVKTIEILTQLSLGTRIIF
jgi:hypothetical protein